MEAKLVLAVMDEKTNQGILDHFGLFWSQTSRVTKDKASPKNFFLFVQKQIRKGKERRKKKGHCKAFCVTQIIS